MCCILVQCQCKVVQVTSSAPRSERGTIAEKALLGTNPEQSA